MNEKKGCLRIKRGSLSYVLLLLYRIGTSINNKVASWITSTLKFFVSQSPIPSRFDNRLSATFTSPSMMKI